MRFRPASLLAVILAAAALGSCGGSAFRTKVAAACAPTAERERMDCACFAEKLDAGTDDQQKKVLLITLDREIWSDPAKKTAALEAAGIDEPSFKAVLKGTDKIVAESEKACKAPKT